MRTSFECMTKRRRTWALVPASSLMSYVGGTPCGPRPRVTTSQGAHTGLPWRTSYSPASLLPPPSQRSSSVSGQHIQAAHPLPPPSRPPPSRRKALVVAESPRRLAMSIWLQGPQRMGVDLERGPRRDTPDLRG